MQEISYFNSKVKIFRTVSPWFCESTIVSGKNCAYQFIYHSSRSKCDNYGKDSGLSYACSHGSIGSWGGENMETLML